MCCCSSNSMCEFQGQDPQSRWIREGAMAFIHPTLVTPLGSLSKVELAWNSRASALRTKALSSALSHPIPEVLRAPIRDLVSPPEDSVQKSSSILRESSRNSSPLQLFSPPILQTFTSPKNSGKISQKVSFLSPDSLRTQVDHGFPVTWVMLWTEFYPLRFLRWNLKHDYDCIWRWGP